MCVCPDRCRKVEQPTSAVCCNYGNSNLLRSVRHSIRVNLLDTNRIRVPLPALFSFNQEERKTPPGTKYDSRRLSYWSLLPVGQPEAFVGEQLTVAEETFDALHASANEKPRNYLQVVDAFLLGKRLSDNDKIWINENRRTSCHIPIP